ncbi:MAG: class B sortase [Lachnospiraceae bacterium]|nr:class B sortase [Lachnospiraceae bacterium]
MNRTNPKRRYSAVLIFLILFCLVVLACCLYKLFSKAEEYLISAKTYRQIRDEAIVTPAPPAPGENPTESHQITQSDAAIIDWEPFGGMDVAAWLILDDISYPVLQGDDNNEYLHALPDHTWNYGGSIFLDSLNSRSFTDENSIIYGHNMADGSMFGKFRSRYDSERYRDHTFSLYLPDGTRHIYTFFSVLTTEAGSPVYTYTFENSRSFLDWQNMLKNSSKYENTPQPDRHAKFVSLSTCIGMTGTTHRLVIIGKETHVETVQKPASWYITKKGEKWLYSKRAGRYRPMARKNISSIHNPTHTRGKEKGHTETPNTTNEKHPKPKARNQTPGSDEHGSGNGHDLHGSPGFCRFRQSGDNQRHH